MPAEPDYFKEVAETGAPRESRPDIGLIVQRGRRRRRIRLAAASGSTIAGLVLATLAISQLPANHADTPQAPTGHSKATQSSRHTASNACPPAQPATADEMRIVVYFWCAGDLYPVEREVPKGQDPAEFAFEQFIAGPTAAEYDRDVEGGLPPGSRATLAIDGSRATVDIDPSSIAQERFLAGANFSTKSLSATLAQFAGIARVEVTYGGKTLCSIDPECGGGH